MVTDLIELRLSKNIRSLNTPKMQFTIFILLDTEKKIFLL